MKQRSERQQEFEAIKQNLFTAGVATVKAAQAQENMFTTTLEALADAYEGMGPSQLEAGETQPEIDLAPIVEALLAQQQDALAKQDYGAYVDTEEKLQRLDELAVARLERQVRLLKAQQELAQVAVKPQPPVDKTVWTEAALKKEYKTLGNLRNVLNLKARSWKDAVEQVNGLL
ncbi:hypothetical protein [Nodosilinea nodulosa]|uniref:hypothetical protein n=1 Tax=Nodosilinea nodulosa TaxID=416001 RepID=UPI0002EFFA20|nr:hypothetical protein [Nodosilinea nodulosa]